MVRTKRVLKGGIIAWLSILFWYALSGQAECQVQPFPVNAKAGVLFDFTTQQFLVEENADQLIEPASFTKLMTLCVAQEALQKGIISTDDLVTVSEAAWRTGGSRMFIQVGTRVPLPDIFKGIAVVSGNDACVALAEHISGSEEVFVNEMNRVVAQIGLQHTVFKNSHGLPAEGQITTARDMVLIANYYIKHYPHVLECHSLTEYCYNNITQRNRNGLLRLQEGVDGLKTGYVEAAGYHLLATAQRDGRRLICAVMGAVSGREREKEALRLLNYGFRNFDLKQVCKKEQVMKTIPVKRGKLKIVPAVAVQDVALTVLRGNDSLKVTEQIPVSLGAPVKKGQRIGNIIVDLDGKQFASVDLVAQNDVPRGWLSYWPEAAIGLLLLALLFLISRLRGRRRKPAGYGFH